MKNFLKLIDGVYIVLNARYMDEKKRVFALNIPEEEFLKKYNIFKEKAQMARRAELNSVGVEPLTAVGSYKEVIVIGKDLIKSIDHNKLQKLNRFRKIVYIKETGVAFLMGLASDIWQMLSGISM
ncbi:MAG: hypothetical protein Q8M95_05090, partial [Candidatus Methanoperedens sp.]|nr:hypothetical protein [Candidatus Methanoperedens sp.]